MYIHKLKSIVMAYNEINKLRLIINIQKIYTDKQSIGLSNEYIYKHYIYPNYYISRATFYNYLTVPARKILKEKEICQVQ